MTPTRFLLCLSFVSLLSACDGPVGGYYDANGNYIATDTPHNMSQNNHAPLPGGTHHTHNYDAAGYYGPNGYIDRQTDLNASPDLFPPQGMCRLWYPDREDSDQPPVQSCGEIRHHLPLGAYVIYGGKP